MANKKSKNQKPMKSTEDRERQRRTRMLQIVFAGFCVLLVLSMVLSLIK